MSCVLDMENVTMTKLSIDHISSTKSRYNVRSVHVLESSTVLFTRCTIKCCVGVRGCTSSNRRIACRAHMEAPCALAICPLCARALWGAERPRCENGLLGGCPLCARAFWGAGRPSAKRVIGWLQIRPLVICFHRYRVIFRQPPSGRAASTRAQMQLVKLLPPALTCYFHPPIPHPSRTNSCPLVSSSHHQTVRRWMGHLHVGILTGLFGRLRSWLAVL